MSTPGQPKGTNLFPDSLLDEDNMCHVVTLLTGTTKTVCTATIPSPHPWLAACYICLRDHGVEKVNTLLPCQELFWKWLLTSAVELSLADLLSLDFLGDTRVEKKTRTRVPKPPPPPLCNSLRKRFVLAFSQHEKEALVATWLCEKFRDLEVWTKPPH